MECPELYRRGAAGRQSGVGGGGSYGFEPLFLARNTDGTIDFYMNCVVGLVHKYYGDDLLRDLFATWDGDLRESSWTI